MNFNKSELLTLFEKLSARVDMLSERHKAIVRLFLNMQQYRTLAKIAGVNEATIARRLKKIAFRISSNNFIAALTETLDSSGHPEKIEIIKDYFVNGLSIRTISKNTGLTRYKVSKIIRQMRNLWLLHYPQT